VYQGLDGVARGAIQRLRIVGVPPKVQPHMNAPNLGVSSEDPGKFVLGTVPVEADGSAFFKIPSGVPVFFQALDADGLAVQTMRSLTYVQPGQTLACIGCHEQRDSAPLPTSVPLAAAREPSKLTLGPSGSWPLRFDQLVQPVLDKHCVSCHRPGAEKPEAAALDLTAAASYQKLLTCYGEDLKKLVFERDRSLVGAMPARSSKLYQLLMREPRHYDVKLSEDDRQRLATWMDTYGQRVGSFSEQQERELQEFREKIATLLSP
jgi:cytochrome c553